MIKKFYFDTYALIEIGKENLKYELYRQNIRVILNKLNIFELSYFLIKEGREKEVKETFEKFSKFHMDYDEEVLIKSAEMKFKFLKDRLSFIDCIGYNIAKKYNAKFLTGDEKFRNMDNVEFVK